MDLGFVPIYYLKEIAEFKANGAWLGTLCQHPLKQRWTREGSGT